MTLSPAHSPQPQRGAALAKIAIVGRGFTGLMVAIALLRAFKRPFHLVMYDPFPKIDGAESGRPSSTLLNSRVRDLSIDPSLRDDFKQWLETNDRLPDQSGEGDADQCPIGSRLRWLS
ncbi:FAD/NAD(P)-binding protein (plasmid) [Ensifer adhaerens]|uniref:FAD/NAD(P)-binding protein n=1 Tax=Ensifer adhaerens TaxID=106592 RepID=UPI001CBCF542|nr:FAD/NAD(P)-binding protein [Ensifer adhaerens]MBZ7927384.1 FAD/NAD(P)-binding protein [Ensifer adhaerens]UAX97818.1 FAD/NAD(P)-binding protein [Ensifer adhaerens]UAY05197.1 FAD/NAD(P)-binding protein [Ensifer adhaerens]UAY12575.1 FAD/NAD(P)-binding protein [Ensifer adhaerens]